MRSSYQRSAAKYLDADSCGSTVGYRVYIEEYERKDKGTEYTVTANVDLSDCSRKIEWSFAGDVDSLAKIDEAIRMFQKFRKELVLATKLAETLTGSQRRTR